MSEYSKIMARALEIAQDRLSNTEKGEKIMSKSKDCVHLSICTSREKQCQHYQTKADIINDFCKWLKNKRFTLNLMDEILVKVNDEWMCASEVYIAEMEEE